MPTLDIFNDDAFSLRSLTLAMQNVPYQPRLIGAMGIFNEAGVTTKLMQIEQRGATLSLVPTAPMGAPGRPEKKDKSKLIPISTVHLPQRESVTAAEVIGVRSFGTEGDLKTVQSLVNTQLEKMRNNLDATIEWQRIGAIKGQVLDADGTTVLMDMFTTFGLTQQTHAMALGVDSTKVKIKVTEAIRKVEDKLGGIMTTGYTALCGKGFFDALVSHPAVEAAYNRWLDGAFLRDLQRGADSAASSGFPFAGVAWREYRGSVSGQSFIGDDDAYLIPMGVRDMFQTRFSPADYMETVNTVGIPYYAKQERMKFDRGVEIESQSNPINFNSRPDAVVKLTKV